MRRGGGAATHCNIINLILSLWYKILTWTVTKVARNRLRRGRVKGFNIANTEGAPKILCTVVARHAKQCDSRLVSFKILSLPLP